MLGHHDQARQCSGTQSLSVVAQSYLSPVHDNKYMHTSLSVFYYLFDSII